MASLDDFKITPLGSGVVQDAFKARIEGVMIEASMHYDADAGTDGFTPILGRVNPHPVGTQVWAQQSHPLPLPGGMSGRVYWVVAQNGETIQVSLTEGGAAVDVTDAGRVVFSRLLADYRDAVGGSILLAVKTDIAGELTTDQRAELIGGLANQLLRWKYENGGA